MKSLFSEGLLIIGWVAMWEPINTLLYGWWPIVHKRNIYQKIIDMDISIRMVSQAEENIYHYRVTPKKGL
jgi:hypothetical protein